LRARADSETLGCMNLPLPTVRNILADTGRVVARIPFGVVDDFGTVTEKSGRPTLTGLNIYILEK
jgi:hypothetical protein